MPKQPTLSVVMSNYNHSKFLIEALESFLNQSFKPIEIIIIDDASTDNSLEILEKYAQDNPIIRLLCNEYNMGVVPNYNRLVTLCSGDYLHLASADNIILPGFFEKSMRLLTQYPQAGFFSAGGYLIDEAGRIINKIQVFNAEGNFVSPDAFSAVLELGDRHVFSFGSSRIYRREAFTETGGLSPETKALSDTLVDMAIGLKYGACYLHEFLSCARITQNNFSRQAESLYEVAEIYSHGLRWMQSPANGVQFPSGYLSFVADRWVAYPRQRQGLCRLQKAVETFLLENRRASGEETFLGRMAFWGMKLMFKIFSTLCIFYFFSRFITWHRSVNKLRKICRAIYFKTFLVHPE